MLSWIGVVYFEELIDDAVVLALAQAESAAITISNMVNY
jgi:hypothetical protein